MKPQIRDLSIYVHIPFCRAKCSYCDFLSFGGCDYPLQRRYVNALCREIEAYEAVSKDYQVQTIFFGGGTPSYMEADLICQIMETIKKVFHVTEHAEITLEGNPDSLKLDKLIQYRKAGINRLSIGLQSTNDEMLARIGRVHNYTQFIAAYKSARQAGFENINVDLMMGLPGENMDSYLKTLGKVVELQPEHISAYSLIVEEGTLLSRNEELLNMIPEEEEDRKMYARTKHLLQQSGYKRYEISNYAKEGYECRHNKVYWTGGEYLGVGLGAASYLTVYFEDEHFEKVRFHGVENIDEYIGRFSKCEGMREDEYTDMYHFFEDRDGNDGMSFYGISQMEYESLDTYKSLEENVMLEFLRDYYRDLYFCKRKDEMEEFMFLGLRMMEGVSKVTFKKRFGTTMENVYGKVLNKYIGQGLLMEDTDKQSVYLSDQGVDVSNVVMAEFML